jgi:hypothetical protein
MGGTVLEDGQVGEMGGTVLEDRSEEDMFDMSMTGSHVALLKRYFVSNVEKTDLFLRR